MSDVMTTAQNISYYDYTSTSVLNEIPSNYQILETIFQNLILQEKLNSLTIQAIMDSENDHNIAKFSSIEELFNELEI